MIGYQEANLREMLEAIGEERTKSILSTFSCPKAPDVERFLHESAIVFARQRISMTYLVFASYKDVPVLVGYYTLANKFFSITRTSTLTSTQRKRIQKFGTYNEELKRFDVPSPLIAQLGKNYTNGYNKIITGDELLDIACKRISQTLEILGGKTAYLECENKAPLLEFYKRNGFMVFSHRPLDADERSLIQGDHLVQLVKCFGSSEPKEQINSLSSLRKPFSGFFGTSA